MGNVLCKNRSNRSGNASTGKNPVDRVIGECMQICPNGIRKKKHFWEKQVFETAPPQEPLQEQPKSQQKNGWQNANLSVPDHPVAPPRKKRTLQRNVDPNNFQEINLNEEEVPETYNERSVDPPEDTTTTTTTTITTTTTTNQTNNTLNSTNKIKNDLPQKVTRTVSKVGNKKSDKFFGESLSDLSTDYENNTTLESTQTLVTTNKTTVDNKTEKIENNDKPILNNEKPILNNKNQEDISPKSNKDIIVTTTTTATTKDTTDNIPAKAPVSIESPRESVVDLIEDIEEELNRKITKERGHLMFAMEKHLTKEKKTEEQEDDRFKNEKPIVEEIIVPVRKVKRHICDDDEKIREILKDHHSPSESKTVHYTENENQNQIDPTAPKKPQRDFAKYRKSLNGDDFDTKQIIEAINGKESLPKEKTESSTQTTGKIAVREKAHHIKQEAENITKNVKSLVNNGYQTEPSFDIIENEETKLNSPTLHKSTEKLKNEMNLFLNTIEKLQDEVQETTVKNRNDIEIVAKDLVENVLDTAQDCVKSAQLHSEINKEIPTKPLNAITNSVDTQILNSQNNKIIGEQNKNNEKSSKTVLIPSTPIIDKEEIKIDYIQEVITAPKQILSDKTTAALKEAQALKAELNSSLLSNSFTLENHEKPIEGNIQSKDPLNDSEIKNNQTLNNENDSNNYKAPFRKEKSIEDCIDCMKNDASEIIHEVVEYAEKVVNDPKVFNGFKANTKPQNNSNNAEEEHIKKLVKKPSVIFFEENPTTNFIEELKKDASQTINHVCEYANKTAKGDIFNDIEHVENSNNKKNLDEDEVTQTNGNMKKIQTKELEKKILYNRPNRISEITPPTQIQHNVYRRSFSTQSVENNNGNIPPQTNDDVLNEIFAAIHEKSKSTDNFLENDKHNIGLPPRPMRNSEINKPSLLNSEKILQRCLSTQSYLTPNLIEKLAMQANILSMPDAEDLGANDGSTLVSPIYRLESKRSIINSQTSLNSEKSIDSDLKMPKTAIIPPLPPKRPQATKEDNKNVNNELKTSNLTTSLSQKYHKKESSPLSSPPREQKIITPITSRSPLTTRSPSPARPSRIPELPKSKLTKRLSRSSSKQSNPDLTDLKKSQELSETLNKFLKEKDLKPQEILDLIEFEFGDCMFSEIICENDKKIINELKSSVIQQQQRKLSPPTVVATQISPPSRSTSRELLVRQNSQSSDSSSSKKSPDRSKSSRIPVLKNNKINELQVNNSDFRRHSIDDLDSWFNPIKTNLKEPRHRRKRENSLQLDFNSENNSMKSSLTGHNVAIKQFLNKTKKTKSATDLLNKSSISFNLTPTQINLSQENVNVSTNKNDHSPLLKYLDNKN